ncbi:MAG: hypothetical protein V1781_10045 [Bacteroidota bacterium]
MKKIITLFVVLQIIISVHSSFAQDTVKVAEFKPYGKLWGYVFGDFYQKLHSDSLSRGNVQYSNIANGYNAFDIRRAYLGYDYNISEKFSTEFLLSHEGQTGTDGNRTVFLKLANLRWKNIFSKTDLIIGEMATPTWSFTEKSWGYRSVEKTILDMRKLGNSNDVGIALQGKFDEKESFGYNIMIGNGTASKIESDIFKKIYGDVYAKFLNQKIIIDLYSDYERTKLSPYHKSKMTVKALLAYQSEKIVIGVETFRQIQENYAIYTESLPSTKKDTTNVIAMGFGGYVRGMILKDKLIFLARYDIFNPDTKFNANNIYSDYSSYNTEIFMTAGLDYMPMKNVHIIPNVWYNSYSNRVKNISGLAKNDYDMVVRITFYYIFK